MDSVENSLRRLLQHADVFTLALPGRLRDGALRLGTVTRSNQLGHPFHIRICSRRVRFDSGACLPSVSPDWARSCHRSEFAPMEVTVADLAGLLRFCVLGRSVDLGRCSITRGPCAAAGFEISLAAASDCDRRTGARSREVALSS